MMKKENETVSYEEMLNIVSGQKDYLGVLKEDDRYEVLYHLSPIRWNLLEWYPFQWNTSLLEIGAGYGAMTGLFLDRVDQVTALVEDQKQKELILARFQEQDRFHVCLMDEDLQEYKNKMYDYVILINPQMVLDDQIVRFADSHLTSKGKLIIAVDNVLSIRTLSGAQLPVDTQKAGVSGVIHDDLKITRDHLEKLLRQEDFQKQEYYYPVPDLRFSTAVYSENYMPRRGEIRNISDLYDRSRYATISEEDLSDVLCDMDKFGEFANSFLVIAEK